jgi:hypothetical protein
MKRSGLIGLGSRSEQTRAFAACAARGLLAITVELDTLRTLIFTGAPANKSTS